MSWQALRRGKLKQKIKKGSVDNDWCRLLIGEVGSGVRKVVVKIRVCYNQGVRGRDAWAIR